MLLKQAAREVTLRIVGIFANGLVGVIQRLLHRYAAMQGERVRAFREQPFRPRVDACFLQQRGEQHAGPFGIGAKSMERLGGGLHRLVGEHRCAVAAALEEVHAGHHRVTRQRFDRIDQRLLNEPMNDKLVLGWIDIRQTGMRDREEQTIGRDRALQQMVRGTGVGIAKFVVGIAAGANDVLLES